MKLDITPSIAIRNIVTIARWTGAVAVLAVLCACATGPHANPADPLEPFNRKVSNFNQTVDDAVLRPVATAYRDTLPLLVRTGVSNVFGNMADVWSFANSVLQLRLQSSAETFMRVNVNTFFGLGGLFDIATEIGIDRHNEDFGQTLGRWGVPPGPYLVLPLLGPSTVRDTAALPIDWSGAPLGHVDPRNVRNSLAVLRVIDTRSRLLRISRLIDDAALDKYTFTRDAFLQRRRNDVFNGKLPDDEGAY